MKRTGIICEKVVVQNVINIELSEIGYYARRRYCLAWVELLGYNKCGRGPFGTVDSAKDASLHELLYFVADCFFIYFWYCLSSRPSRRLVQRG